METVSFETFRESLQRLGGAVQIDPAELARIHVAAAALQGLPRVTRTSLASLIRENPTWVPYVALCVGISKEQLKNLLRHHLGTTGHVTLAKQRPAEVIALLDSEFGLLAQITTERKRSWTFADILAERAASRSRASGSIRRGRRVEDQIEAVVKEMNLRYVMRSSFVGLNAQEAGCDLAVPEGGARAAIVCAMKGFDSTGSKLSDTVNEIRRMAEVREPRQFVYVVIDGIGWNNRQRDLRRIHELAEHHRIDGLFNLSMLAEFQEELATAARRLGLLPT